MIKVFKHASSLFLASFFVINNPLDLLKEDYSEGLKIEMLEAPYEVGLNYFKSPQEIDAYITSLSGFQNKHLKSYMTDYKPLILSASNIFKVPFSFQSCLIYRESAFNPRAKSSAGALGVAQFTRETFVFLSKALRVGGRKLNMGFGERKTYALTAHKFYKLTKYEHNIELYKSMHSLWSLYLKKNNLKSIKLDFAKYRQVLTQPDYAIGLSSLYLYYLKHKLQYEVKERASYEELLSRPDFFLAVAGAYNQGARRLLRAASRDRGLNLSKWIRYQSRVRETRDYIKAIKSCMKSKK